MHVRGARMVVAAFVLQNHGDGGAVRRPAVGTQAAATEKRVRRGGGEGNGAAGASWCDRTGLESSSAPARPSQRAGTRRLASVAPDGWARPVGSGVNTYKYAF